MIRIWSEAAWLAISLDGQIGRPRAECGPSSVVADADRLTDSTKLTKVRAVARRR